MSSKGNQIRSKMIKSNPIGDALKHPDLESHLTRKYPKWTIFPQCWLTFTKGEDEYQYCSRTLTKEEVEEYNTAHPDYYIIKDDGKILLLELDGSWHDTHISQTVARNDRYRLNKIPFIVVNETDLKFRLRPDIKPTSWKLTQQQINDEFDERLKMIAGVESS